LEADSLASDRSGVVVWSRLARRSSDIAKALRIRLYHLADRVPYLRAWKETPRLLREVGRDACVVLQLPPGPAAYRVTRVRPRPRVLCDVHTGMFYYVSFKEYVLNRPFLGALRRCDHVLAHNPESRDYLIRKLNISNVSVIYDPLPQDPEIREPSVRPRSDFVVLPVSWEPDEDIAMVVEAFSSVDGDVSLVITGDYEKRPSMYGKVRKIIQRYDMGGRVVLTGYVGYGEYLWYISNSIAVIALTNREYTVLSAMWEAALYDKPIVYPRTRTLSNLLGDVDNGVLGYDPGDVRSLAQTLKMVVSNVDEVSAIGAGMGHKLRGLSLDSVRRLASLCYNS